MLTELSTACPPECSTLSGVDSGVEKDMNALESDDYRININDNPLSLIFEPNRGSLPISITILEDDNEELREYFCLSVKDANVRGSQWWTRIFIPWNDRKELSERKI